jgi:acid phosphatase (class A)
LIVRPDRNPLPSGARAKLGCPAASTRRHARKARLGIIAGTLLALLTLAHQDDALAQNKGYLSGHEVDFHTILGPPPAVDSRWDHADQELVEAYQNVDAARFESAKLDEQQLYSRFEKAFGHPIDSGTTPLLVELLDRAIIDVDTTASAAKSYFNRPRPYQRMPLHRVCNKGDAPVPEEHPMHGASYPSGHSVHGWTVAMILSRVAPDRTQALMDRAEEFEESRLICGMHFPTDVEAGQVVAAAVVSRLDTSKEFRADVAKARKEYTSH